MSETICESCGNQMVRGTRPMTMTYKGLSTTFDMPGLYCEACGEDVISGSDTAVSDRELNKLKAEADGLLQPEQIRRIRKKLQLTQIEAGFLLGGGRNAFQRYELGSVLPSQAISNLLRLLDENPLELDILRRRPNATPQKRVKALA